MSLFKKGLVGYLPANILQGLIGFATLTVFTRILSPDDYGRYALAFGVSSLVYTIFFTWMEAAMARFYVAESRDAVTAPMLYGTVYRTFVGVFLLFAVLSAIGLWLWHGNPALKLAVGYSLAAIVPRSLVKLVQEQRRAEGRVGQASVIDMIQTAGGFAIGVACALAGMGGASPIIGAGVIAALCLPLIAREDWGRAAKGRFDTSHAKTYAQYGFPVAASLILTLALYTADRFLIAHFLSEAQAGAYHAGFSLASRILDVLFIWFGAAGAPAMVHALETGGESALKATARQQLTTMAFVLFPAVGGLIMVAPSLGGLVIGGPLRDAALRVTPLISIGALFSGLNTYYFLQAFTLAKKTRLLVVAMAIPAISNIVLNVLLIPRMGLVGAGLASALSFGMGLAGSWLLGLRTLRLPVPVWDLAKVGLSTVVMMIALSLLPSWGGVAELLSRAVAGLAIYGTLAWLLDLNGIRQPAQRVFDRVRTRVFA
jgi:O-antigen/teichoic acid export membrane protein